MAGALGVTVDKPPNHLYFDPPAANEQVMAREQQIRNRRTNENQQPQIVIHNHIAGAGEGNGGRAGGGTPLEDIVNKARIPLAIFCERFELSEDIQTRARSAGYSGPHGLCLASDEDLKAVFLLSQVADLKMALSAWKNSA
jgi:hypothetical protein